MDADNNESIQHIAITFVSTNYSSKKIQESVIRVIHTDATHTDNTYYVKYNDDAQKYTSTQVVEIEKSNDTPQIVGTKYASDGSTWKIAE
jgi:hypothetical protein